MIVDAVNDSEPARDTWLQGRTRRLSHQSEPTWEQVQARAQKYESWRDPPVSIDGGQPVGVVVDEVAAIVRRPPV